MHGWVYMCKHAAPRGVPPPKGKHQHRNFLEAVCKGHTYAMKEPSGISTFMRWRSKIAKRVPHITTTWSGPLGCRAAAAALSPAPSAPTSPEQAAGTCNRISACSILKQFCSLLPLQQACISLAALSHLVTLLLLQSLQQCCLTLSHHHKHRPMQRNQQQQHCSWRFHRWPPPALLCSLLCHSDRQSWCAFTSSSSLPSLTPHASPLCLCSLLTPQ